MNLAVTHRRPVHLVEIGIFPGQRYSATLGYLQAVAEADPELAAGYVFHRHIESQAAPTWKDTCARVLDALDDPFVVAFTIYFWNRSSSFELARMIKLRWPRCRIVVGGNDVTNQQQEVFAQAPWVDVLVHGEGELRFAELLRRFLRDDMDLASLDGISYWRPTRQDRDLVTTRPAARISDLDTVVSPILGGVYADDDISDTSLFVYETNRGCPYHCAFCYWGGATNQKIRQLSTERVTAELDRIVRLLRPGAFFMVADANFGILPRDLDIARHFVELCDKYDKRIMFHVAWAKNTSERTLKIARLLAEAGTMPCVSIAIQSFDPVVLDLANRSNIKTEHYQRMQDACREMRIPTQTDLIWGMPGESYDSFKVGIEQVLTAGGSPVINQLLLLNNTDYKRADFRAEHGVVVRRLPVDLGVDMIADTVVAHDRMSHEDWLRGLDLRVALYLYQKSLLRATLRLLSGTTGVPIGDWCEGLWRYLTDECPDPVVRALARNHTAARRDPDAFDRQLVDGELPALALYPAHVHYAALLCHVVSDRQYLRDFLVDGINAVRKSWPALSFPPPEALEAVLDLDVAGAVAFRARIRGVPEEEKFALPTPLFAMLREFGDLRCEIPPTGDTVAGQVVATRDHVSSTHPAGAFEAFLSSVAHGYLAPLRDYCVFSANRPDYQVTGSDETP